MYGMRIVLTAALVCGAGSAWVETAGPEDPSDKTNSEMAGQLSRDIDIDLIDVERLREVVEGQVGRERLRISLEQCVHLALEGNQEILVIEYDTTKSDADIFAARGEFDPMFNVTANYSEATQELGPEYRSFAGISAAELSRTDSETSVGGKLHWGTMYNVQFNLSEEETTWNSFNEEWTGTLTLTVAQPLLRGRGRAVNKARIRMAKYGREASEQQLRLVVMTTVAEVVKSYWDLVGAIESVTVRAESLSNAERLLDISKKRLDIGTAAAIEVLQAKAGVAMRQSELIAARARVADAEDFLKALLDMRDSGIFSNKQIIPLDRPTVAELSIDELGKSDVALAESIALALDRRPELALSRIEIDNAKLDLTRASNNLLPELNLTGSLTQGGRNGDWRGALYGVRDRSDNGFTVGLKASVPIGNRAAKGARARAEQTLRQAEQRLEKTKQEAMLKVRMAARATNTSQILVESNHQARALQETNVVAEEKRLRLGVSTSYRVLQIQEDLTAAQVQELQAQIAYEKALVELRLAEGSILDALGVAFNTTETRPPVDYLRRVTPTSSPQTGNHPVDSGQGNVHGG